MRKMGREERGGGERVRVSEKDGEGEKRKYGVRKGKKKRKGERRG